MTRIKLTPEDELALRLKRLGVRFERQVQPIPKRRYAFDFQCFHPKDESVCVLVEVQGGVYMRRGGHNTGNGITRDCEKACLAAIAGHRVMPVTSDQVRTGQAERWILSALGLGT